MEKYFISYNRDEFSHLKNQKDGTLIVDLVSQRVTEGIERIYFDNIAFISLDKDIFDNINKWMKDENTTVIVVSDYNVFYGWTEKELISAINYERPIFQISIKKFIKFYVDKKMLLKDVISKKAKKLQY